jgi:protein-tyrosine phosphatase
MIARLLRRVFKRAPPDQDVRCRILFVCMGNFCRSPTAEAVFKRQVELAGLAQSIGCESAGTHGINPGGPPDGRARAAAARRGYDMTRLRGRQLRDEDFASYDLIVAMDRQNLDALRERCPEELAPRLQLFTDYCVKPAEPDVPDPYYGNAQAFEVVLDIIEDASTRLLEYVREHHLVAKAGPHGAADEPAARA